MVKINTNYKIFLILVVTVPVMTVCCVNLEGVMGVHTSQGHARSLVRNKSVSAEAS